MPNGDILHLLFFCAAESIASDIFVRDLWETQTVVLEGRSRLQSALQKVVPALDKMLFRGQNLVPKSCSGAESHQNMAFLFPLNEPEYSIISIDMERKSKIVYNFTVK